MGSHIEQTLDSSSVDFTTCTKWLELAFSSLNDADVVCGRDGKGTTDGEEAVVGEEGRVVFSANALAGEMKEKYDAI